MEISEVFWFPALTGGVMIGCAASILMAFNGRVAGISGILGDLLRGLIPNNYWRLSFILGLMFGGGIVYIFVPQAFVDETGNGIKEMVIGGLLVGLGTRLGSGCTSGHGVCGIGMLSKRSMISTLIFVTTGMFIVYFIRGT